MPVHEPLIYQIAASSQLPATERYVHWLAPLLSDFEAAPPDAQQLQNFQGRVTSLVTATSELHDMESDSFDGSRSRLRIRQYDNSKLALVYVMQGQVVSQYENDTDTITNPGQFLLFDAHRPNRIHFSSPRFVQINVPRAYLQTVLPGSLLPSQISKAVSQSGLAGLLASQLSEFRDLSARLSHQEQLGLLHATESLATTVVEYACAGHKVDGDHDHGWYVAAQRYINLHLDAADLSGASIAAALGCSRSTLYRAFARQDLSLAAHIRELRLQTLARLLQRPAQRQPISQLALRCGLHNTPNLSRLFRQRFGVNPRDFRARYTDSGTAD